jgi:hypothetical protein
VLNLNSEIETADSGLADFEEVIGDAAPNGDSPQRHNPA